MIGINLYYYLLRVVCGLSLLYVFKILRTSILKNTPPGPSGIPFIGYIPFLTNSPFLKFIELSKKYGEIFSLRLGCQNVVVLNGVSSIREAFSKNEILARSPHSDMNLIDRFSPFFVCDVPVWREQRRFVIQTLRDLGLGKSSIENHVQDEVNCFIEHLKNLNGKSVNLRIFLIPSISNNICSMIFGKRFDYDDQERILLDTNLEKGSEILGQLVPTVFFPWIKHVPYIHKLLNYESGIAAYKKMDEIFRKYIKTHEEMVDPKNPKDFVDRYIIEIQNKTKKNSETSFTDRTLIGCVSDLFDAGSETVRTAISWIVYVVAAFPTVQAKIRSEIMDVIGSQRIASTTDLKQMPYTHAVVLEVLRWKTIVPLSILRYTTNDTTVGGFDIPQGTIVVANFWAVHHDSKLWKDPEEFNPDRFLGNGGTTITKPSFYMPFSVGKRSCPGEAMAYMEIFLYLVSMVQNFDLELENEGEPTFEADFNTSYKRKPYQIKFLSRKL